MLTIWIGYDSREDEAGRVARESILRRASRPVQIKMLRASRLRSHGLYDRLEVKDGGRTIDVCSEAPVATEFSNSRFLSILLNHQGAGLFIDCDIVCLADICELMDLYDEKKAVQVVQHNFQPGPGTKMDGAIQTAYARKAWSSVMLFNSSHPGNRRLTQRMCNNLPGRMLHRFHWLRDDEIGALPPEWNWLVGVQPKPAEPKMAHFTLGGPFTKGWQGAEHDEIYLAERERHHAS